MNKLLTSAALLGLMAASTAAMAEDAPADANAGKVKCYGVAEAGKNDCKASDGTNSCAGSSTRSKDAHDWKYATAEECKSMGGSDAAPAAQAAPAAGSAEPAKAE